MESKSRLYDNLCVISLDKYTFIDHPWHPFWKKPFHEIYKKINTHGFQNNHTHFSPNALTDQIKNFVTPILKKGAEKLTEEHLDHKVLKKNEETRAIWLLGSVQNDFSFVQHYLNNIQQNNVALANYLENHKHTHHDSRIQTIYNLGMKLLSPYCKKIEDGTILSKPPLQEFLNIYHSMEVSYQDYFHQIVYPNNPHEGKEVFKTLLYWNTLQTYLDLETMVDGEYLPRAAIRAFQHTSYSLLTVDLITIDQIKRAIYPEDGEAIFSIFSINGISLNHQEYRNKREQYITCIFENLLGHLHSDNEEKSNIETNFLTKNVKNFLSSKTESFEGQEVLSLCAAELFMECLNPFNALWHNIDNLKLLTLEDKKGTNECHIHFRGHQDFTVVLSKKFIIKPSKSIQLSHNQNHPLAFITMVFEINLEDGKHIKLKKKFFNEFKMPKTIIHEHQNIIVSGLTELIEKYSTQAEKSESLVSLSLKQKKSDTSSHSASTSNQDKKKD